MLELTDYGALPDGSDCTPALNAALTAAAAGPIRTIHVPAGQWSFLTSPIPFTASQRLVGEGYSVTQFIYGVSNGHFLVFQGNGCGIKDITLLAGAGTSGSVAIHCVASDAIGPGGVHIIENVWVTSLVGAPWAIPIFLDGAARTVAPVGIRTVTLRNVTVFNAQYWAMEWWNTIACEWFGGGAYQGAGVTQNIVVGGALATGNLIHANIPGLGTSTIWPGSLRSGVL